MSCRGGNLRLEFINPHFSSAKNRWLFKVILTDHLCPWDALSVLSAPLLAAGTAAQPHSHIASTAEVQGMDPFEGTVPAPQTLTGVCPWGEESLKAPWRDGRTPWRAQHLQMPAETPRAARGCCGAQPQTESPAGTAAFWGPTRGAQRPPRLHPSPEDPTGL